MVLDCEILGCSVDSVYTHLKFAETSAEGRLGEITIPLLSDVTGELARSYGVYNSKGEGAMKGVAKRYIIDLNTQF
jgi:alkyl hydroperoxide reductase subunit AhpC